MHCGETCMGRVGSKVLHKRYPKQFFFLISQMVGLFVSFFLQLEIQLKNVRRTPVMNLVDVNGSDVSGITYTADHLNDEFVAYNASKGTEYYWALPKQFLGNKVKI